MKPRRILTLLPAALLLAACIGPGPTAAPTASPTTEPPPTTAPTEAPTEAPTPAATASAAPDAELVCGPVPAMPLKNTEQGFLTIGTDNPAFPPYFEAREGGNTEPWDPEWGDPTTGEGFESAVAYAIAAAMGFTESSTIEWIVVPFNNSFAPGPKDFDFDINQVSIKPERDQAVDFSEPYYFGHQAVVVAADGPFAGATTVTELKSARLGAQVGTTSFDAIENVIQPTAEISVYDTNDAAIQALAETEPAQIDAIVVDLPTAFFIVNVQTEGLAIIGQLGPDSGAEPEAWGLVMEEGSELKPCVDAAIAELRFDGTLDELVDTWLEDRNVPELQP